jgi:hypothetical protein
MAIEITRRRFIHSTAATAAMSPLCTTNLMSSLSATAASSLPSDPIRMKLLFLAKPVPSWPTPYLDVEQEMKKLKDILAGLQPRMPDIVFEGGELLRVIDDAPKMTESVKQADGVLIFNLTSTVGHIVRAIADCGKPTLLFSQPYSGHDWSIIADMQKEGKKIDVVASSDYNDLIAGLSPIRTVKRLSQSKILILRTGDVDNSQPYERLGVKFVPLQHAQIMAAYEAADPHSIQEETEQWIQGALNVVEPSREDILKSSRFYLAMKQVMQEENAQGIAINCLGLFSQKKLPAYPCLGFTKLNDTGFVGACEADAQSALTMLLFQYLTGKPGFISDPVIDTATNTVIHAHCVAPTCMSGKDEERNPYIIRSHLEDDKGAALQVKMTIGKTITMAKIVGEELMLLSTGDILDNPDVDRGCRTKITTQVADARKVLQQYSHGLHRVIFYDDHTRAVESLSKYLGFKIVYET